MVFTDPLRRRAMNARSILKSPPQIEQKNRRTFWVLR